MQDKLQNLGKHWMTSSPNLHFSGVHLAGIYGPLKVYNIPGMGVIFGTSGRGGRLRDSGMPLCLPGQ